MVCQRAWHGDRKPTNQPSVKWLVKLVNSFSKKRRYLFHWRCSNDMHNKMCILDVRGEYIYSGQGTGIVGRSILDVSFDRASPRKLICPFHHF